MSKKIISPCISICKTDPVTGYCYGCARTNEEKKKWKDENKNAICIGITCLVDRSENGLDNFKYPFFPLMKYPSITWGLESFVGYQQ